MLNYRFIVLHIIFNVHALLLTYTFIYKKITKLKLRPTYADTYSLSSLLAHDHPHTRTRVHTHTYTHTLTHTHTHVHTQTLTRKLYVLNIFIFSWLKFHAI